MESYKERNSPDDKVDRSISSLNFVPQVDGAKWITVSVSVLS